MGIIDYLIRNCLIKSLAYITIFFTVICLLFLDYSNLKSIEVYKLSEFIQSNSISYNLNLVFQFNIRDGNNANTQPLHAIYRTGTSK